MKYSFAQPLLKIENQFNAQLPKMLVQNKVPGLSIALIFNGETVYTDAFGVADNGSQEALTVDTLFEACSLSKPAFAYVVMMLVENGRLSLDVPLSNYLPNPYIDNPLIDQITARHVLSHQTGFPNWRPDCWGPTGWEPEGKPLRIAFEPGSRFSYSGEGYMYLQRVIEHLLGTDGESIMQTHLFQPLEIQPSSYLFSTNDSPSCAKGHDEKGKPFDKFQSRKMISAASLHTTPALFAKLLCAIMTPAQTSGHLSKASLNEMVSQQVPLNNSRNWHKDWPEPTIEIEPNLGWSLGWGIQNVNDQPAIWHWGDNYSFRAFTLAFLDEGVGIVAMANGANATSLWKPICEMAFGGTYPAFDWLEKVFG